jgi:hypothetical protein
MRLFEAIGKRRAKMEFLTDGDGWEMVEALQAEEMVEI